MAAPEQEGYDVRWMFDFEQQIMSFRRRGLSNKFTSLFQIENS